MLKALIPLDGSDFSQSVFENVRKLLPPQLYSLVLLEVSPIPEEFEEVMQGVAAVWATRVGYKTASENLRRALEPDRSAYVERVWKANEKEILAAMEEAKRDLEFER